MSKLSTTVATDPAIDLAVVREMATEFDNFIVDDEVYRTVVIRTERGDERIQSSGGDLLARMHRLSAQRDQLSAAQQSEWDDQKKQVEQLIKDFRSRFHDLLVREAKARLNSLKWFLDECQEDRRQCRIQYPFEIRNRQRVGEIWKALEQSAPATFKSEIEAIDRRIRGMTAPSEFVWDSRVQSLYPKESYWYLYALPPA